MTTAGERIKERRNELGWTQDVLAQKAGISKSFLSDLENGKRSVGAETLLDIARALGRSIDLVWQRADFVDARNEAMGFRKDQCGAWIQRCQYGSRTSPYGWEVDHIVLGNKGGSHHPFKLRPLHWQNNVASSDDGWVAQSRRTARLTCGVSRQPAGESGR